MSNYIITDLEVISLRTELLYNNTGYAPLVYLIITIDTKYTVKFPIKMYIKE